MQRFTSGFLLRGLGLGLVGKKGIYYTEIIWGLHPPFSLLSTSTELKAQDSQTQGEGLGFSILDTRWDENPV